MISSNDMSKLLFAQSTKQSTTDDLLNLKAKTAQRTTTSDFKSVFDSAMSNKSAVRTSSDSAAKNQVSNSNDPEPVKFKAFREITQTRNVSSANAQTSSTDKTAGETKTVENASVLDKSEMKTYDEAIYALAQMLGIQPGDLIKLAEMAGFNTEDLTDPSKVNLLAEKLTSLMGLNADQQAVLKSALTEISSQLASTNSSQSAAENNTNATVVLSDLNEEPKAIEFSKLAQTVKAKLDELMQTVKSNPEAIGTEVSKVIAAMKSQAHATIIASPTQTAASETDDTETLKSTENVADTTTGQGTVKLDEGKNEKGLEAKYSKNSTSSDESKKSTASEPQAVQNAGSTGQNTQQEQPDINLFAGIKANTVNNQVAAVKQTANTPTTVKPSEVLNQVIETAKVVVGQDKSEMVIHLKPDHLGKLELKVVTEQGIVAAKFIAESQQVKEVIETNMQLLKESLQKQGLAIDGVSVQVGQDSRNQYTQSQANTNNTNKTTTTAGNKYNGGGTGLTSAAVSLLDSIPERLAQYANDYNTINLTA